MGCTGCKGSVNNRKTLSKSVVTNKEGIHNKGIATKTFNVASKFDTSEHKNDATVDIIIINYF